MVNYSFRVVSDNNESIAIRAFSLMVLYNMSLIYPDKKPELKLVCEEMQVNGSVGLKSRAEKNYNFLQK